MGLFALEDNVVRAPFLIKGVLIEPPFVTHRAAEIAFEGAPDSDCYRRVGDGQVIRERIMDRRSRRPTDDWLYIVLPSVRPVDLIERDVTDLARGLYRSSVDDVERLLDALRAALQRQSGLMSEVKAIVRMTSTFADVYLEWIFSTLQHGFDSGIARQMIDRELGFWGVPGHRFLESWVELEGDPLPDIGWMIAQAAPWRGQTIRAPSRTWVRAMPTRQVHITAGNSPNIPFISALRLLLTKSAGVVKLPMNGAVAGGLFSALVAAIAPNHLLARHLSVVYWKGGDAAVEDVLFQPNAFDRIVVWGAPGSVSAVQARASFTRMVAFNPRYGVSILCPPENHGVTPGDGHLTWTDAYLHSLAVKASLDVMIYGQNACNASFVQYIVGDVGLARRYAEVLAGVLSDWDRLAPPVVPPSVRGQIRRLRRGKQSGAEWFLNTIDGEYSSAVVVVENDFELLDHPLNRFVVVRPVSTVDEVVPYLHAGVSTVGIAPEAARLEWRDVLAASGVTNILPLGECERVVPGMPHDGMVVLNQLVEWKQS